MNCYLRLCKRRLVWLVFVVGVMALAGVGYAMIGEGHEVIHGCYNNHNGQLRLAHDGGECNKSESSIFWNQTGPVGPAGPQGPQGDLSSLRFYVRAATFSDLAPSGVLTGSAHCNPGDQATGGGVGVFSEESRHEVQALFPIGHPEPTGWSVRVKNIGTEFGGFTVNVVCASLA